MTGFSEAEREQIREELLQNGEALLIQYGPKKTTITDITDSVGISKPMFYRFFDSKANLYLEILERASEDFYQSAYSELDGETDPYEGLTSLLNCYRSYLEENPLVQQVFLQDNYRELLRNVSPELLREIQQEGVADLLPLIRSLQDQSSGQFAEYEPTIILGVLGTLALQVLHKDRYDEYEEGYYDEVMELLIDSLAKGLTAD
ncbi:TetR/AcrR family transcriptional regulator [Natronorubrum sp. FCH18a]|uniref:TetR/AcrR family transcriptional regulator n=1 Tax=Natronorubrum sp. FCH18a TaxID=3447018 RepID=UPI003F513456